MGGLTTFDGLTKWGSVAVFGGGVVAAVRTGASTDPAYGRWKRKKEEKDAVAALEKSKTLTTKAKR